MHRPRHRPARHRPTRCRAAVARAGIAVDGAAGTARGARRRIERSELGASGAGPPIRQSNVARITLSVAKAAHACRPFVKPRRCTSASGIAAAITRPLGVVTARRVCSDPLSIVVMVPSSALRVTVRRGACALTATQGALIGPAAGSSQGPDLLALSGLLSPRGPSRRFCFRLTRPPHPPSFPPLLHAHYGASQLLWGL